jgi:hypothetical protein
MITRVGCALLPVLLLAACALAQEKDFFPLGIWYEGGVGDARDNVLPADPAKAAEVYDANFKDIAAHGINVMTIPNSPPEHHKLVLDTAQKHGLKVILELGLDGGPFGAMIRGQKSMDQSTIDDVLQKTLAPIKDHPALPRVQLLDEPPNEAFARYGQIAEAVRKFDPAHEPFCCLTGGSDGGAFLKAAKSDVVAFDYYPISVKNKKGDIAPLEDFAKVARRFVEWAGENNARSWAVVQCHEITGQLRYPTAAELRCMTWTSLAQGNKGVFWFLYQSEHVGKPLMGGLVDRDFKPQPLWKEVARLARELKPLAPKIMAMKDAGAFKARSDKTLARKFTTPDGKEHLIIVNLDTSADRRIRIDDTYGTHDLLAGGGKLITLAQSAKP